MRSLGAIPRVPDVRGGPRGNVRCQYKRGGICRTHGPGAIKKFKPVRVEKVGPGGEVTFTIQKKTFYVCDLGMRGTPRRQTTLPFVVRTTSNEDNIEKEDTSNGNLGQHDDSEGQYRDNA